MGNKQLKILVLTGIKSEYDILYPVLNELQEKYSLSYIFISHNMKIIRAMSDYILVLKDGKIIEEGDSEDIFNYPKNNYTQKLIQSII